MTSENLERVSITTEDIIDLNLRIDQLMLAGIEPTTSEAKLQEQLRDLIQILELKNLKLTRLSLTEQKAIHGMNQVPKRMSG